MCLQIGYISGKIFFYYFGVNVRMLCKKNRLDKYTDERLLGK